MNKKSFDELCEAVREMGAHMRGEEVPGAIVHTFVDGVKVSTRKYKAKTKPAPKPKRSARRPAAGSSSAAHSPPAIAAKGKD